MDVTFRVDTRVRPEDVHASETFHSFAERVMAFCSNMCHTVKTTLTSPAPAPLKLTEPQPFKLATDSIAARRAPVLSTEELEERAMKEYGSFKARPVDPRVLSSAGDVGVAAKVARKATTVVEPFTLESERLHKKALEDKAKALAEEEDKRKRELNFRAAPVPETAKAPLPAARPAPKPLTVPTVKPLSSDLRAAERERFEAEKAARAAEAERLAQENAAKAQVNAIRTL